MRKGVQTTTKRGCIPPRHEIRHILTVSVLTICMAAGAAFAQPPQPEQEQEQQQEEQREQKQQAAAEQVEAGRETLRTATRRNVLARTLEQLHKQVQETEEMLRRQEGGPSELRQVLRAELQTLDELIAVVEDRLQNLGPAEPYADQPGEPAGQAQRRRENQRWRQEVNESIELIRQELAEIQELREHEDNRWNEVHENFRTMRERASAFKQHLRATAEKLERVRAEQREMGERHAEWMRRQQQQRDELIQQHEELRTQTCHMEEQSRALAEQHTEWMHQQQEQRDELVRQHEELRTQTCHTDERVSALKEHCSATSEELRRAVEQLHTDLQRMGQTVGRTEQERLEANSGLQEQVEQLGKCTQQLREELARTQGALQMLLAEANRSTVGSAGLSWAW